MSRDEPWNPQPHSVAKYEDQHHMWGIGTAWEVPKPLREYTSAERKAMPIASGVLAYFPDALAAVSRVSKKGNDKHNPGEPLHWSRGKSKDHDDCVVRHLLTPNAIDPDSGEVELAHAAWRLLAQLQLVEEKRLTLIGIKPLSGVFT